MKFCQLCSVPLIMDFAFVFPDLVSISPCLCHYVQVCLVNYLHLPVYLVPVCSVCQYCTCACLLACGFTFLWIN